MALSFGSVSVDPPVVLAPMAGITDAPFRVLCAEHGGGLYVSEMITARGLVERNAKTLDMIRFHEREGVRSLQLFGSDPVVMRDAVRILVDEDRVDHVDINMGCPVSKVMRKGAGAALPVKRKLLAAVVRGAVSAAGDVPVTIKVRMGLDDDRLTYLDAGRVARDEGAAAIALHARTVVQGYSGNADRAAIARLKETVGDDLPVLGNGDIWAAEDAVEMMAETGCDGVVVGRGCLGRPWLFGDLSRVFAGEEPLGPPPFGEIAVTVRRHLDAMIAWHGIEPSLRSFRQHLGWYLKGYAVGGERRRRANQIDSVDAVDQILGEVDPALEVEPDLVRAPRGRTSHGGRLVLPQGWWEDRDEDVCIEDEVLAPSGG